MDGEPINLGSRRQRSVLALLVAHGGRTLSSDRMIEDMWLGSPPPQPLASLQVYVSNLRRALEPDRLPRSPATVLVSSAQGYALRLPDEAVDAWRFENALRLAHTEPPRRARQLLEEALSWWHGVAYGEFANWPWAEAETFRMNELRATAQEMLAAAALRSGRPRDAVLPAAALTREHPLREEGWRLLAVALWASGSQAEALTALRRCRQLLGEELGLDPGSVLMELEQAILEQRTEVLHKIVGADQETPSAPSGTGRGAPAVTSVWAEENGQFRSVGRERDLARVSALLPPPPNAPHIAVVLGEPGMGKSVLLAEATSFATARDIRILRLRGAQSEQDLAFAGLHQLLRTVMPQVERLPVKHGKALLSAFGLDDPHGEPEPAQRLMVSLATLNLLSTLGDEGPLAILVDDGHWIDRASLDVLGFLARRLEGEPIGMLVTARGSVPPPGLDRDVPYWTLAPLAEQAAEELLDRQPFRLPDAARQQVLELAGGNPLALIELAKAAAQDSPGTPAWQAAGLPLTARLTNVFSAKLAQLPQGTLRALVFVAASGTAKLASMPAEFVADVRWTEAEQAGLVQLQDGEIQFRHPLVRSAVYHSASPALRREAHRALADSSHCTADQRAWHLAEAAVSPDEEAARALEASADRALRRSASVEVTTALERAAQLSATPDAQARRLVRAAHIATYQDRAAYVSALSTRVMGLTDDPEILTQVSMLRGWAAFTRNRQQDALGFLLPTAATLSDVAPEAARASLTTAASAAFFLGDPAHCERVLGVLPRFPAHDPVNEVARFYTECMCSPYARRGPRLRALRELAARIGPDMRADTQLGAVADVFDEPELTHQLMPQMTDPLNPDAEGIGGTLIVSSLGWIALHQGRLPVAEEAAARTAETAPEEGTSLAGGHALVVAGAVSALRGDTTTARAAIHRALSSDFSRTGVVTVRARWALGTAARADGDHEEAYRCFRDLFTSDGRPVHYQQSYYGLADLAAAARHSGRSEDLTSVRDIVRLAEEELAGAVSARMAQLLAHARALLSENTADAEGHYNAALADPLGEQWPLERAATREDYGYWLLAHNKVNEARGQLTIALDAYEQMGVLPWAERTRQALMSSGVQVSRGRAAALGSLSALQRHIVQLAAEGLDHSQIGARLLLSPRAVALHLEQLLPALGVSRAAELGDFTDTTAL
ncbi:BTAD domain-containing putative transcriptional regulator [Streptomyces tauricus]|uniref:BTAD domain-containing putative transcriptional regulator n=1 Tax=Streptomyces tauricus TaxID=68274 RepID=UPI0033E0C505